MKFDLLENICELIIDCPHSTPKWTDSGVYVIRNQNIVNNRLDLSNPSFTDEHNYLLRTKRVVPKENDIILTREAPMGRVCLIPPKLKICQGQRQVLLRGKENINPKYLYYALQSPSVKEQIFWNEDTGSTVSNIRIPVIKKFKIPRLLNSENKIAHILSTLDDKIELNKKINQTLESIAQAIFKSWFVDFDPVHAKANANSEDEYDAIAKELGISREVLDLFPNEFEESYLGLIPKGWEVMPFNVIASQIKKNITSDKIQKTDIYIGLEHIGRQNIFLEQHGYGDEIESNKSHFEVGDLLFGKLRPYFHKVCISPYKGICSTDILIFRAKDNIYQSFMNLIAYSNDFVSCANNHSTGTRMPRASAKDLLSYKIIKPSDQILCKFEELIAPIWKKGNSNIEQNTKLKQMIETILPKLLSGNIDVSNLNLEPEHD